MITASRIDGFEDVTSAEWTRGAMLTVAVTLLLVSLGVILDKTLGDNAFAYALMYSSWLIGFTVGARNTFLKPYSSEAKNVITASAAAFCVFFLVLLFVS